MERSFSGDDPPFDLVGCDDLLLVEAARAGHVASLDEFVAARRVLARRLHAAGDPRRERPRQALRAAVLRRLQRADLPRRPLRAARRRGADDDGRADRRIARDPGRGPRRRPRRLLRHHPARRAELRAQLLDHRLDAGDRRGARAGTTTPAARRSTRPSCAAPSSTTATCSSGPARPSRHP